MNQGDGKILILHPMIQGVDEVKEFFAGVGDVEIVGLSQGVECIHNREDEALVAVESMSKARDAEEAGYQAIVLTCHGDTNLYSIREAVRIPVVGVMEVAMHFCATLAYRFSILVPDLAIKRWQEDNAIKYGLESKVTSIRVVPWEMCLEEVFELARQKPVPEEVIEPALSECIKAIKQDDATAITFGCAAFKNLAIELGKQLKDTGLEVPLVNPLPLGVDIARVLIKHGLTHSLRCYPGARIKR